MKPNRGKIDNWQVAYQWRIDEIVVVGNYKGKIRKTSPIIKLTKEYVETENSIYELGKPKHLI